MDLRTAECVHESLTEFVTVSVSPAMLRAVDRVAAEARCTREAVMREYVAEGLPDGWLTTIGGTQGAAPPNAFA